MADKTFSAPQAYIVIDGKAAGYIRNISWSESIQRVSVRGLGSMADKERPATGWNGNFTVDEMFIDLTHPSTKALFNRVGGKDALINTLTMGGEFQLDIVIFGKIQTAKDEVSKLVSTVDKEGRQVAKMQNCFVESQNWSLAEGGIAGINTSGTYINPVVQEP